jgi:WD40 repeat protein
MGNFRRFDRATGFLLPPSLDEWLPERHLARFVVEVIDGLDLSAVVKSYRGSGSAGYHPALLLGLLVYGYTTGVKPIGRPLKGDVRNFDDVKTAAFSPDGKRIVTLHWDKTARVWNAGRRGTRWARRRLRLSRTPTTEGAVQSDIPASKTIPMGSGPR